MILLCHWGREVAGWSGLVKNKEHGGGGMRAMFGRKVIYENR